MARTIVMIHPGGLGDVLLAVPAMIRLRARFPNHRLVLCAEDQVAKLLVVCGIIAAWVSVQGPDCSALFAGVKRPAGILQRWLEQCDLAIGWLKDLDSTICENLKALGAREVIVRSPFSSMIYATHQRDRFLEAINEPPFDYEQDVLLAVPEPLYQLGRACLEAEAVKFWQPLVVIHPGSGSAHKCVAPETLASVVKGIQSFGAMPVVLEGPSDREPVEQLLRLCMNRQIVLKGLDLLTVAGVLAQARLFVGHDSGITHLAGLMGVRTVALFGPTDPDRWAPSGPEVTAVQGVACLCQSWNEVSLCKEKHCLDMPRDHVLALCLAQLRDAVVGSESNPASCH
jgi:ADP-heptose:LPS heptosyltransferase